MPLTANERETTITSTDGDDTITIWTAQRRYISRMRKNDRFTEVNSGNYEGSEWAEFTIPANMWNPASGAKRKSTPMSEEQRLAAAERLARARKS